MSTLNDPEKSQSSSPGGADDAGSSSTIPGESVGDVLGHYRLLDKIGEGGMGTVWRAQQSEPVQREVALKIIKLGMDTKEIVARFEVERQALAIMDHPHIAKVFDGGATQFGRPYFVMELVPGVPITRYCNQERLGLAQRLRLFVKVCDAIQHAHHRGIIHRDIKPSNILVAAHAGGPEPKVIDFGIAKAIRSDLTQSTLLTHSSQTIGSPEYMAPEQTEMSGLDVDTRADVYSLGVVFYELLTGRRPFNMRKILEAGQAEMLRTIREVDPPKPSLCVMEMGEQAAAVALERRLAPDALSKRLRGDLDWIAMMALEKDRTRRFRSANDFANDVVRHLNKEAVYAAPSSALYRLRKLIQRRRSAVVAGFSALVLLLAGSIGTGVGWWRTTQANWDLDIALKEKEGQRALARFSEARALEAEEKASSRADALEQVTTFQAAQLSGLDVEQMGIGLRHALLKASANTQHNALLHALEDVNFTTLALGTLREYLFERALKAIDAQFVDQPLIAAQLQHSMAGTLRELGLLDMALDAQLRALAIQSSLQGDADADTLESKLSLGDMLAPMGRFSEAETYIQAALEGFRELYGDEHPRTLDALSTEAYLLQIKGQPALAEPIFLRVLEGMRNTQGAGHADTLKMLSNLAVVLHSQGKFAQAEARMLEAIAGCRQELGELHPDTLGNINNLGVMLRQQARLKDAEVYFQEALLGKRRKLGDEHPATLKSMVNLGALLRDLGRLDEAEVLFRGALQTSRYALGNQHADTLTVLHNLGFLLFGQSELEESESYLREASEGRRRLFGVQHAFTQESVKSWGTVLDKLLEAKRAGTNQAELGEVLMFLGEQRMLLGSPGQAERFLGEALEILAAELDAEDWRSWYAQGQLALSIAGQLRFDEAEQMLLQSVERLLEHASLAGLGAAPEVIAGMLQNVLDFYAAWHAQEPAGGHDLQARPWQAKLDGWGGE